MLEDLPSIDTHPWSAEAAIEPGFVDSFALSQDSNESFRGQSEDRKLLKGRPMETLCFLNLSS